MANLTTSYLGLQLKNPIIASSSPLTQKPQTAKELEAAGASAIIMHSLFEEKIILDGLKLNEDLERGTYAFSEAMDYFPEFGKYSVGPEHYLDTLSKMKKAVSIPVLGSLNGVSTGGWLEYARQIQDAGADGLELNIYYLATDTNLTGMELEDRYVRLVEDLRKQINIPLAVKLSPFFTALPNFAVRLSNAGANGLVLFNRFYQPDFDLDAMEVYPNLVLSNSDELRLPMHWIGILFGRVDIDLALTGGVHTGQDVLKAVMAGSCAITIASELLDHGVKRIPQMLAEITGWMEKHEYSSIKQMQGSMSQSKVADPDAFERVNYMKVLSTY